MLSRSIAISRNISRMGVPGVAAVRPGVGVNIILKADQRSGKLTKGRVQDLLTRGDHPRGIKVRLQDGQIGRVQSLDGAATPTLSGAEGARPGLVANPSDTGSRSRTVHIQDDYRDDPVPAEERSLEDYVTIKHAKTRRKGGTKTNVPSSNEQELRSPQEVLQQEFPQLDTALVAAILGDSGNIDEARKVLGGLS